MSSFNPLQKNKGKTVSLPGFLLTFFAEVRTGVERVRGFDGSLAPVQLPTDEIRNFGDFQGEKNKYFLTERSMASYDLAKWEKEKNRENMAKRKDEKGEEKTFAPVFSTTHRRQTTVAAKLSHCR